MTAGASPERSQGASKHAVPFAPTKPTASQPHSFPLPHSPWGPRPGERGLGELIRIVLWCVRQGAWPGLFPGARPWDPFPISCLRYAEQAQAFLLGWSSWSQANSSQVLSHSMSFLPQLSILLGLQELLSPACLPKATRWHFKVAFDKNPQTLIHGLGFCLRPVISFPIISRANIYHFCRDLAGTKQYTEGMV